MVDLLGLLLRAQVQNPPPFEAVPRPGAIAPEPERKSLNELNEFLKGI